ncbi:MAG: Rieske (2Fe-2S) protein [Archangium sp.]|nr:Rieske (2Fe-2S) protein [Archangium sp.]
MTCSRRCVVAGGLALAACGPQGREVADGSVDAGEVISCSDAPTPGASQVRIELSDVPALRTPGGAALVERPDVLLNVWVLHLMNGCFTAVWRVCTHGACDVEARENELYCPCHGSRFALDGAVLQGPATRALRAFRVVREGETLLLER